MTDVTPDPIGDAIRAGCETRDYGCDWPTCACDGGPERIRAAIAAYLAALPRMVPSDAEVEGAARAHDPVGWGWYDRATADDAAHPERQANPTRAMFVADQTRRARAALATLSALPTQWRPIETAPKDGTDILGWNSEGCEIMRHDEADGGGPEQPSVRAGWIGAFAFPGCSEGRYESEPQGQPTHWMPLPPMPGAQSLPALPAPDAAALRAEGWEDGIDVRAELRRWREDSMEQARAINRLVAAALDRNEVDAARENLHAEDVAAAKVEGFAECQARVALMFNPKLAAVRPIIEAIAALKPGDGK